MTGHLLLRGMLVGLLAGVLAFGFAKAFGEPQIDKAIAFEDHMAQMHGDAPEEELVSREVQSTFGLFTGVVVYSVSLGGLFALGLVGLRPLFSQGVEPRMMAENPGVLVEHMPEQNGQPCNQSDSQPEAGQNTPEQ